MSNYQQGKPILQGQKIMICNLINVFTIEHRRNLVNETVKMVSERTCVGGIGNILKLITSRIGCEDDL